MCIDLYIKTEKGKKKKKVNHNKMGVKRKGFCDFHLVIWVVAILLLISKMTRTKGHKFSQSLQSLLLYFHRLDTVLRVKEGVV